jgi:hypothetical protein
VKMRNVGSRARGRPPRTPMAAGWGGSTRSGATIRAGNLWTLLSRDFGGAEKSAYIGSCTVPTRNGHRVRAMPQRWQSCEPGCSTACSWLSCPRSGAVPQWWRLWAVPTSRCDAETGACGAAATVVIVGEELGIICATPAPAVGAHALRKRPTHTVQSSARDGLGRGARGRAQRHVLA